MPSSDRVEVIIEVLRYSRRFRGSWFVARCEEQELDQNLFAQDLLMLRALGIHVCCVVAERNYGDEAGPFAIELRRCLNAEELCATLLHWSEIDPPRHPAVREEPRWQQLGTAAQMIVVVRVPLSDAYEAASELAVNCSAAKLTLLEANWDHTVIPIGGPNTERPKASEFATHLRKLATGRDAIEAACSAVERGVDEAHIIPSEFPHALLVEIFTEEGIGTWIGR